MPSKEYLYAHYGDIVIKKCSLDTLKWLGKKLCDTDKKYRSVWDVAAIFGRIDILDFMDTESSDILSRDKLQKIAISIINDGGKTEGLQWLLEKV